MSRNGRWISLLAAACMLSAAPAAAQEQKRAADVVRKQPSFHVSEFKITVERYSLLGRGLVRTDASEFKNRTVGLRVRYVLRLKHEPFVYNSSAWVVLKDGAGLVEINAFVPEFVLKVIREEKDYPVVDWHMDGWFFMNPGTIGVL